MATSHLRAVKRTTSGILLSEVESEQVSWLWRGWLALDKLSVVDGDPGLGKSATVLDVAARVSTGRELPDGTCNEVGTGGVVVLSAEDGLRDTIKPRLEAAGADLGRIASLAMLPDGSGHERLLSIPEDLPHLEAEIWRMEAKLVVVDPLWQNRYPDLEDGLRRAALQRDRLRYMFRWGPRPRVPWRRDCPECGWRVVVRTAGGMAGFRFWRCERWPALSRAGGRGPQKAFGAPTRRDRQGRPPKAGERPHIRHGERDATKPSQPRQPFLQTLAEAHGASPDHPLSRPAPYCYWSKAYTSR